MEAQRGFEIATKVVPVDAENPDEISEKVASDIADYLVRLNGPPAGVQLDHSLLGMVQIVGPRAG